MADVLLGGRGRRKEEVVLSCLSSSFLSYFSLCSFGEKGKILGKTIFSLLGSSFTLGCIFVNRLTHSIC